MTAYALPLSPSPRKFSIFLSGTEYNLTLTWCAPAGCWILDIADANGAPLLTGRPIITGADLLAQFAYVGVYGQLVAQTDNDPGAVPTFDNLGSTSQVYYLSDRAQ